MERSYHCSLDELFLHWTISISSLVQECCDTFLHHVLILFSCSNMAAQYVSDCRRKPESFQVYNLFWSDSCLQGTCFPLHWLFNHVIVQTANLCVSFTSLWDSWPPPLPCPPPHPPNLQALRLCHMPFHLCSPPVSLCSLLLPSSHVCLLLLLGLFTWRPIWALRPMSGLVNKSWEKEWKRRGERKPEREKETRSETLSRHGREKAHLCGNAGPAHNSNYLLGRTWGKQTIPERSDE